MAYFPADMPEPAPTPDDAAFWAHCAEQRLRFQCCARCELPRHPPTPLCSRCGCAQSQWVAAPELATIFTFTVVHHASHPAVAGRLPYVVAVVEFPALAPVRLVTNVTDVDPAEVRIGMPVQLWWDRLAAGDASNANDANDARPMFLPRFRPPRRSPA